jgi:hypothetical protein
LKGALAAVVVTLLFPPFAVYWSNGIVKGQGFGFILSWPYDQAKAVIHLPTLFAEWITIATTCIILWVLTRDKPEEEIMTLARRIQADPQARDAVYGALRKLGRNFGQPFL